jgi:hypothetical protein
MLRPEHVQVPTDHVPRIIGFPHRLGDVAGDRITRIAFPRSVLQAVDEIIDARINVIDSIGVLITPVQAA